MTNTTTTRIPSAITLAELRLIHDGVAGIDPDEFATMFYDTLFERAPQARAMFPDDLDDQRRKLMSELTVMITMATAAANGEVDRFTARAHRLGARHAEYGAVEAHYELVGSTLVAVLAASVPGWDDDHLQAWAALYGAISSAMLDGARVESLS